MTASEVKHITHVYRIADHPTGRLPEALRIKYLSGLGAVLYTMSCGHPYMQLLFNEWCVSILGKQIENAFNENTACPKQALTLNRLGWKFFSYEE
jgi:hypothetical protein